MKPKLMLIGHARHGKDTVAELLKDMFGYSYVSPTWYAAETFIYDRLKASHGYKDVEECITDRVNHRKLWYDLIQGYNHGDPARLIREVFGQGDIYVGCRAYGELEAAKKEGLMDMTIWVEAALRKPLEGPESISVTMDQADIVLDNNEGLDELKKSLIATIKPYL